MTRSEFAWLVVAMSISRTIPVGAEAQDQTPTTFDDLQAYCESAPCRQNAVVRLRLPDGRIQEETSILHRPAITQRSVSVLLGEEVRAVPEFDDETFTGWRTPERREPSRNAILTFKLEQAADGSISAIISNTGDEPLKLRMDIRPIGASQGEYTSSCPVVAEGTIYAYWEQPVAELIVHDAVLLSDDMALMCD
jgi:hypothetical protein